MRKRKIDKPEPDATRKLSGEIVKPISVNDLLEPEDLQQTSAKREWEIKKLQERLGVSRDIAEKMLEETRRPV